MNSRGLTLLECVIGMTMASALLAATCAVLLAGHRSALALVAALEARENSEVTASVLRGELRAAARGEILALTDSSITLRALRGVAHACAVDSARGRIIVADSDYSRLRAIDPLRDSVRIFAERNPDSLADDSWLQLPLANPSLATCPGGEAGIAVVLASGTILSGVAAGAPLRVVEVVEYRPYLDASGDRWFGTRSPSGTAWSPMSPIAGPLLARGLELGPRDSLGQSTTSPDSAALFQSVVRTWSRTRGRDSLAANIGSAGP